jgi:hypothetical protein
MRVKVTQRQFDLLLRNLKWLKGLSLEMKGETFRKIMPETNVLKESKIFSVELWFGASPTSTIVTANNSAQAVDIVRKMFPKATVYFATPIKGKLC